jgi:hypothetical protein
MSLIVGPHHPFASTDEAIDPIVLEEEILIVRQPGSGSREMVSQALSANGVEPAVLSNGSPDRGSCLPKRSDTFAAPVIRCQGDLG